MIKYHLGCVLCVLALPSEAVAQPQTTRAAAAVQSPTVSLQWRIGFGKRERSRRDANTVSLSIGMTDGERLRSHWPVVRVTPASGHGGSLRVQIPVLGATEAPDGETTDEAGKSVGRTILIIGGAIAIVYVITAKEAAEAIGEGLVDAILPE